MSIVATLDFRELWEGPEKERYYLSFEWHTTVLESLYLLSELQASFLDVVFFCFLDST